MISGLVQGVRVVARPAAALVASLLSTALLAGALCELDFQSGFAHPPRGDSRLKVSQSSPTPKWSPDGNQIVFSHIQDAPGIYDATSINVAASDGSTLRTISKDNVYYFTPDISPDGSRVAYVTVAHDYEDEIDGFGDFEIEISGLDGSGRRRLTNNTVHDVSPLWSPDGSRIAFAKSSDLTGADGSGDGFYTMAADGSDVLRVLPDISKGGLVGRKHVIDQYPLTTGLSWSPNGKALAFLVALIVRENDGVGDKIIRAALYTIGAEGAGLTQLYVASVGCCHQHWLYGHPAWSPDGRELAFFASTYTEERGWSDKLYVIGLDGSGPRLVIEMQPGSHKRTANPQWSPNGTKLLFTFGHDGSGKANSAVYVVNADGTGLQVVGEGTSASWSPDGSRIAILDSTIEEDKAAILFTEASDGSDVRVVVRRNGDYGLRAANAKCILSFCW